MDQEFVGPNPGGKDEVKILTGMEDEVDSANNMVEQEESTGSAPGPSFSGRNPKRLRSKAWDDFTPIFVGAKIARAECMHCHHVYNVGSSGTSNLLKHQAKCSTRAQKRPTEAKLKILPSTQKSTIAVNSGSTQKKLLFSATSQKKCLGTADKVLDEKVLACLDIPNDLKQNNQKVDHDLSQGELATNEKKKLASRDTPIDKDQKTKSHEELVVPEQDIPTNMNQKISKVDQGNPLEELSRIFSVHGHPPLIRVHDRFTKFVACLNPMVKMQDELEMCGYCWRLFDKEKTKLKEKFAALRSRVCLSAYVWHYDLHSAFLCLSVHYIDDEWEKQRNIIKFEAVDPSCNASELSQSILYAIRDWGLCDKIFGIILGDTFMDDSVASDVKARLPKWNLRSANQTVSTSANRSLFAIRYATHLVNQVIQVGKDELDKVMDKSTKCSKYTKGHIPSVVHYPNHRYALSPEGWTNAKNICKILEDLQRHKDEIQNCCNPADLFDKVWDVKKILHRDADFYFWGDKTIFKELEKMQNKFKEHWKLCCLQICMPMIMDPSYRLKRIKSRLWSDAGNYYPGKRRFDDDIEDYIEQVHDILLDLFCEYSDREEDTSCSSGPESIKGLMGYYQFDKYPYFEQPVTELDQYMQEPSSLSTGESGVLQWWKEHELTFPTIARMARDILAIPPSIDYSVATRTARRAFCESSERWIEHVVCLQDWLRSSDGSTSE